MDYQNLPNEFIFTYCERPNGEVYHAFVQQYVFGTVVNVVWLDLDTNKPQGVIYSVEEAKDALKTGDWVLQNDQNLH